MTERVGHVVHARGVALLLWFFGIIAAYDGLTWGDGIGWFFAGVFIGSGAVIEALL